MALSYRRVLKNDNLFVIRCCLYLAIFGRLIRFAALTEVNKEPKDLSVNSTELETTNSSLIAVTFPYQSCINWRSKPEAAVGNCSQLTREGLITCYSGMNNLATTNSKKLNNLPVKNLLLCGWLGDVFNSLSELQSFSHLQTLSIEYSGFTQFEYDFPEMFYLEAINISWTNLSYLSKQTFHLVHALKILDLRWNKLIHLDGPGPLVLPASLQQLYLSRNSWHCSHNFNWLLLEPEQIQLVVDRADINCTERNFSNQSIISVMFFKIKLANECESQPDLHNCSCQLEYMGPRTHAPVHTVNCSHLQFNSLPSYLPPNTTKLIMNNNLITDLSPLRDNPHYRQITQLQLNNNRISSIDVLENTDWLQNFWSLHLKGNLLHKMQLYALENSLSQNHALGHVLFSNNPWHCTCNFGIRLRDLLNKYSEHIRDAQNITCTYLHGDELRLAKVLTLTRQDICNVIKDSRMHPIDWLNAVLAGLILLIFTKLGYDYYFYKYHGRIPWIVLKMP